MFSYLWETAPNMSCGSVLESLSVFKHGMSAKESALWKTIVTLDHNVQLFRFHPFHIFRAGWWRIKKCWKLKPGLKVEAAGSAPAPNLRFLLQLWGWGAGAGAGGFCTSGMSWGWGGLKGSLSEYGGVRSQGGAGDIGGLWLLSSWISGAMIGAHTTSHHY